MFLYLLTLNSSGKVYIIWVNLNYLNLIRNYSIMIHCSRRLIWQQYVKYVVALATLIIYRTIVDIKIINKR